MKRGQARSLSFFYVLLIPDYTRAAVMMDIW